MSDHMSEGPEMVENEVVGQQLSNGLRGLLREPRVPVWWGDGRGQ